jgi:hypothetical protein
MSRWWLGDPPAPEFEWDSGRPVRHPDGSTVTDIVGALNAQLDLFDRIPPYPTGPGWKEPSTSREAAASVDASTLRLAVRGCLDRHGAMTADECAARLGLSVLTIRPRFSELKARGEIADTGQRRRNASGKRASVWELVASLVRAHR